MKVQIQTNPSLQCNNIDLCVNVKLSLKKEFRSLLETLIRSDGHVEQQAVIFKVEHIK